MKVGDNTLSALRDFFNKELIPIYQDETQQLFKMACEHYLGLDYRKSLDLDLRISESEMLLFFGMIKRLKKHEPIQHIIGYAWFYDLRFKVSTAVLIPRPETEELVHWVLSDFPSPKRIIDLCTGSGCIPIALKANRPDAKVSGFELSEEALHIASYNAGILGKEVDFIHQDVLQLTPEKLGSAIDVIVSNPPYILPEDKSSMADNVLEYEPHMALFAPPEDLFAFYRKIADLASKCLVSGGKVYVEIHPENSPEVKDIFLAAGLIDVQVKHDISNRARMVRGTRL